MTRMTGGTAITDALVRHGVETVFALPGVQLDHLFNAFHDARNKLRILHPRHEQGAAYMAFGYAQAGGRPGVYAVVPGPGILNTTAALSTAYACGSRVVALTGQIPAAAIGQEYGLLHEIPDQLGVLAGLTKHAARIEHPTDAPEQVREAFRQLSSGRPRPVALEMAMDLLGLEAEIEPLDPALPIPAPTPDPREVEAAATLLAKAERPLIVCGGGAVHAGDALLAVAEWLQAPVISHRLGRGIVSDRHPLGLTQPAGHRLWADADVVLAVGTRFQQHRMVWGMDGGIATIRIDIDPLQLRRQGPPTVGLLSDAREGLRALADALSAHGAPRPSRATEIAALESNVTSELERVLTPQMDFIRALREALPERGILVDELTQVGYVSRAAFPVYEPRTFISSGYQGTLGSGFPTALGARVACPDRPVLSINGDGGFMFNVAELATAVQHGIDLVAVVFRDDAFGNVKRMQEDLYGQRVIATELRNPDFVALAQSFGAEGVRAETPAELGRAVSRGFERGGVTLVEVPVGRMPEPWGVSQPMTRSRS